MSFIDKFNLYLPSSDFFHVFIDLSPEQVAKLFLSFNLYQRLCYCEHFQFFEKYGKVYQKL